ncbi:Outer membrane protein OprM precursor [Variovorax sp. PBL-H6]|uniref:efflux transporter outer membrane subunit n=1 Tax=Variovorax sp. PBL-H6 TaxID=434009 RepID=UPI001317D987|nr:efflux transporter outer membrane subunit [Variovorax sp. PBL-H6]VTU36570.1 Outer membrane protein OprM precursor [Variovorax sp. PBL-H6]
MSAAKRRCAGAFPIAIALGLALQACSTVPAGKPALPAAIPEAWQGSAGRAADAPPAPGIDAAWWKLLGDPVLDSLVQRALDHNDDLRAAAARVAEARALAEAQRSAALPTLDFGVGASRGQSISAATGNPYLANVLQPQFQAAYEVDLWGRIAELGRAADAQFVASQAARDSAALSVAATTASSYINLLGLDARLEVARRTLAARESALELARSRQQRGYSSALETQTSEAEYRATAQAIPQLLLAIRRQEHALGVLTGAAPGAIARGATLTQLSMPPLPDAGLPSDLLRRRPDLASAEAQLVASDAQLAASRAQLLPSLRLSASLGSVSSTALVGDPSRLWSLGGSVLAPIFEGGRLRAQVRAADARREQALANYEKAVLTGFSEVEDQLAAIQELGRQTTEAEAQRRALQEAVRVASNRYREGYASHLDELDARRNLFGAEQTVLQLRADSLTAQVGLYRALGGGWHDKGGA